MEYIIKTKENGEQNERTAPKNVKKMKQCLNTTQLTEGPPFERCIRGVYSVVCVVLKGEWKKNQHRCISSFLWNGATFCGAFHNSIWLETSVFHRDHSEMLKCSPTLIRGFCPLLKKYVWHQQIKVRKQIIHAANLTLPWQKKSIPSNYIVKSAPLYTK